MTTSEPQPSIASLTHEINILIQGKQQWELDTSEALGPIRALRDYASVLRISASQAEVTATLLQEHLANRMKALFDEPVDELRMKIRKLRDEYERMLREDIVLSSSKIVIPERVPTLCVLFETYTAVNSERMRLPPDVMEGIIPMVGREKSRVFYREVTFDEWNRLRYGDRQKFPCMRGTIYNEVLRSILRRHDWFVFFPKPSPRIDGCAHYYDDDGNERAFAFEHGPSCVDSFSGLTIHMEASDEALLTPIIKNVLRDIERSKRSRQEEEGE